MMVDAGPPPAPPPLTNRRRPAFEPIRSPLSGKGGKLFLLLTLTLGCAAAAFYMYAVQRMPATDMRVAAPAIGAVWFGLRVFMNLTPKV